MGKPLTGGHADDPDNTPPPTAFVGGAHRKETGMSSVLPYAKALVAAVIAGLTALGVALADEVVTSGEWVSVAIAFFVALGGVYVVPNKDPQGQHQDESVQPTGDVERY